MHEKLAVEAIARARREAGRASGGGQGDHHAGRSAAFAALATSRNPVPPSPVDGRFTSPRKLADRVGGKFCGRSIPLEHPPRRGYHCPLHWSNLSLILIPGIGGDILDIVWDIYCTAAPID